MQNIDIGNTKLEELIEQFTKSTEKDKSLYVKIMEELEKSVVLLPAQVPTNLDEETENKMKAGQPVQLKANAQFVPCILRKNTGEQAVIIYTSVQQIPDDKKSPTLISMPFFGCVSMIMANKESIEALIVNPYTHCMILPMQVIEMANRRRETLYAQSQKVQVSEEQFRSIVHNQVALRLLPAFLFQNKEEGLQILQSEQGNKVYELYRQLFPDKNRLLYSASQFSVMTLNMSEQLQLTRVELPEDSQKPGMCYRVYVAYRNDLNKLLYYSMEKTQDATVIGTVSENGQHEVVINLPDNCSEMEMIMDLANAVQA